MPSCWWWQNYKHYHSFHMKKNIHCSPMGVVTGEYIQDEVVCLILEHVPPANRDDYPHQNIYIEQYIINK